MSHPVFLESPPWPRMPEGRKGELKTYFSADGPSLEANAYLPLFWRVLFSVEDIHFAYVIDEFDPDDEAVEIEEFLEGATQAEKDAKYPYLVTTKALALERAARRRDNVIELLGERYRPIFDAFVNYLGTAYGGFILVRTGGLPDVTDATEWITTELEQVAALDHGAHVQAALADEIEDLRRISDTDAVWRSTGTGNPRAEVNPWPSRSLVETFPACAPRSRPAAAERPPAVEKHQYRNPNAFDKALEWVAILMFAAVAVCTWAVTRSVWKAVVATVVVTGIMAWLLVRVRRTR
ncbi:hypothetical protein [Pandoraea sputorum]|uniref:Uncharacterized protein n=1 Tax=Pandoraea sputorum TaxID=93222 RepID=A0A239SJF6_9BURK|nr:hypothetical protein [Pandoraea sputorum]BET09836.1 hypothetical protein THI4931_08780 [Pandoraea sputorum]SNU85389.1 Uncharacterised protein [Pandoraea sputorum]VVD85532.1 hypothetical protein PSP20601_01341 [Pandoraea sputorum]